MQEVVFTYPSSVRMDCSSYAVAKIWDILSLDVGLV